MKQSLVVYYSFSGNTKALAYKIAALMQADIKELLPIKNYSFNYNTAVKEARNEVMRGFCPELLSGKEPIDTYELVFIGTPNWFKSIPPPVLSFLRQHDFSNKTVVPFCTHGGGGMADIEKLLAKECVDANILPGFSLMGEAENDQIVSWLKAIGCY